MNLNTKISPINNIIRFFVLLIIEILTIAFILIFAFQLNFQDIINDKIPEIVKNIYIVLLYSCLITNLYFSDKTNFINSIKIDKSKLIILLKSFSIGFLSLFLLYILEISFNLISLKSTFIDYWLLVKVLITSFLIGLSEELLFRNFIFRKLSETFSFKKAVIISSYIYAQLHFLRFNLRPEQIVLPLIGLFFVGCILSYSFHKKGIAYSTGIHSSWVLLISYTTQNNSFIINDNYLLLTGGYYPISGILGIIMSVILLISIYKRIII